MADKKARQKRLSQEAREASLHGIRLSAGKVFDEIFKYKCEDCGQKTVGFREYDHSKSRAVVRCLNCFKAASKDVMLNAGGPIKPGQIEGKENGQTDKTP